MPPFTAEVKTPRSFALWVISEVEMAFPGSNEGDERVRKACQDLRNWVDKEWTLEREKELVSRERVRWESVKEEATGIIGAAKWTELEQTTEDVRLRLKASFEAFEREFLIFEKESEVWKSLTKRLRDAAATGASKQNVVKATEEAKSKTVSMLKKDSGILADMMSGQITLSSLAEKAGLEAAKYIGVTTQEKDQDKIAALGALVRFRKGGVKPTSPAALLVKVSDAVPIYAAECKKIEEAMCVDPGARSYIEWFVGKVSDALTEDRLKAVLDQLDKLEVSGSRDKLARLAKAIHERDVETAEHIIKSTMLSAMINLIPQLDLPPIEGVRDGIEYTVRGMDLSSFSVDEKNIRFIVKNALGQVLRGDPLVKFVVDDVSATIKDMQWSFRQDYFPFMTGQGIAHAQVRGVCIVLGFQLVKRHKSKVHQIVETVTGEAADAENKAAGGSASSTNGTTGTGGNEFVPQLVLGVSRVSIDSVKIDLEGSSLYSMLTDVFAKTIRTYASSLMQDIIVEKVNTHLEKANEKFATHAWETLSSALEIDVDRLPTEETAAKRAEELEGAVGGRKDVYSVTFTKEGPMGLALGKWNEFVVVKSFKKAKDGSALPAELSGKIKIGDILVGFNGGEVTSLPLDRVTTRISRSRRPLTLTFAPGDVHSMEATKKRNHACKYTFEEEKLFLLIKARHFEDRAAVVTGFRPTSANGGGEGPAEKAGVPVGWVLAGINGINTLEKTFKETMDVFVSTTQRPIDLKFVRDPDYVVELNETPADLRIASFESGVVVSGFEHLKSPAETLLGDGIQSGDFVSGISGKDTTLMKFDDVISLMRTSPRPMEIRFGRLGVNGITSAASFGPGPLGMVFYKSSNDGRCCFKAFQGIEGPVERLKLVHPGSVIRSVNGVEVKSEQQCHELLSRPEFPMKIVLRDMEAYEAGGWKKGTE